MSSEPINEVTCCECGKPMLLTTALTNERGQPVHQECYERRMVADWDAKLKAS